MKIQYVGRCLYFLLNQLSGPLILARSLAQRGTGRCGEIDFRNIWMAKVITVLYVSDFRI